MPPRALSLRGGGKRGKGEGGNVECDNLVAAARCRRMREQLRDAPRFLGVLTHGTDRAAAKDYRRGCRALEACLDADVEGEA